MAYHNEVWYGCVDVWDGVVNPDHEVGCPHREWPAEILLQALELMKKMQNQGLHSTPTYHFETKTLSQYLRKADGHPLVEVKIETEVEWPDEI